jgi:hypothetical protein
MAPAPSYTRAEEGSRWRPEAGHANTEGRRGWLKREACVRPVFACGLGDGGFVDHADEFDF